jgi:hypothetical protein
MTGAFDTNVERLRSYEAKLRTSADELRAACTAAEGVDLTRLPDGSAGEFAESATFGAGYRGAAGLLWPEAMETLRALDNAADTLGDVADRYQEQEAAVAATLEAIRTIIEPPP